MHSSFILFSLLTASTMAFPRYFSPYNIPPPSNNYPPYNYPPYNFLTPQPGDGGYTPTPPPEDGGYTPTPPPEDGGYTPTPPPPENAGYTPTPPPPPHKSNNYGTPPPTPSDDNDKNGFLAGQNAARKAVTGANMPELAWSETLAAYALNYANQRKDCALQHSGGPYGENIAEGSDLSAEEAVNLWVGEKDYYNYDSNKCTTGECGHYTQVVWKNSTKVGCARVTCNDNLGFFATCNYSPPGNYVGERPY